MIVVKKEQNLVEIIKIIYQGKKIILVSTIITGILSILLALYLPNKYESSILVAPVGDNKSSQLSGLSKGLASFAGANINAGDVAKLDVVLATLESRQFILDFIERREIKIPLMAGKRWDKETRTLIIDEDLYDSQQKLWTDLGKKDSTAEQVYIEFKKKLSVFVDVDSGLITVSFKFLSPVLARNWVKWIVYDINEYQRARDVSNSIERMSYLQHQITQTNVLEIKDILFDLIKEQIKIKTLANTKSEYFLTTIDPAIEPEFKVSPQRLLIWIIGILLGSFIGFLIVYVRYLYVTYKAENEISV